MIQQIKQYDDLKGDEPQKSTKTTKGRDAPFVPFVLFRGYF
jgi:hypothetical protein